MTTNKIRSKLQNTNETEKRWRFCLAYMEEENVVQVLTELLFQKRGEKSVNYFDLRR